MDPPPLTHRDFLGAVQAVQQSWEARAREFSPGWTPADWARDLTHLISAEIWDQESLEARARVIRMLEKRRNPDICSGDFPSFDLLEGNNTSSELAHYSRGHNPWTSWLHCQVVLHLAELCDAEEVDIQLPTEADTVRILIEDAIIRVRDLDGRDTWAQVVASFENMVGQLYAERSRLHEKVRLECAVRAWETTMERVTECVAVAAVLLHVYLPSKEEFAHEVCRFPRSRPSNAHSAFAARPRTSPGPASTPVLHAAATRLTTPHAHPRQRSQGAGPPPATHQLDPGARRSDNFLKGIKSFYRAQQPEFATEVDKILVALVHDCGGLGNERLFWLLDGLRRRGDDNNLPPPTQLPPTKEELDALYQYSQPRWTIQVHPADFSFYDNSERVSRFGTRQ